MAGEKRKQREILQPGVGRGLPVPLLEHCKLLGIRLPGLNEQADPLSPEATTLKSISSQDTVEDSRRCGVFRSHLA